MIRRPNTQLMELYGTDEYYLEKCGAIPPGALRALKVLAPVAFLGLMAADRKHQKDLVAEAEMMNQMFRAAEAERMAPIRESFGLPSKSASVEDIAEETGRWMAKRAGIGGEAMAALGKVFGGGGKAAKATTEVAKKSGMGWKGKATLGLGAAGLGYAGLKGAQTARDYMMIPSQGGSRWGAYGQRPPTGVNEYGYAQQRF